MNSKVNFNSICNDFANILNGKSKTKNKTCSVSLHRTFGVIMMGKDASSILGVSVEFYDLDNQGNALNISEIAILQEEIPAYLYALTQQGIIVSAIHNHWLFTDPPQIMYIHAQSVEPPLQFAKKMAYAFSQLSSLPVASA
ncbi:methyltransferase [Sporosarcina sp. P20a]|uniref:DUF1259 domain-containing protein n=1 Tax=Sporosarcina sp. P20a TaxID=2048256 RepID=UPI000C17195E|nr:DUF1259 domain-containing protein [Sporosarcina sp. P20a]PIC87154.1 methyltransferase [Sporosarcina sp. P20a]